MKCLHQLHLAAQKTTYAENEVLCKDIVGSHSSSTMSTEGYFWNIIRKKTLTVTWILSDKSKCLIMAVIVKSKLQDST